ncbi:type II toxin-antitoxin system Phd/YefM family antitoxin [Aerococcaceae bacterium DSM 111020]|nr:type II toxin-antitoxin system Phd/YefM family antitoxin [Aerococcaceae bacterium DSM 111020]
MIIRPVSDLRNHFSDIESQIKESNDPVFLTKNGYGSMILMPLDQYDKITDQVESKLDEADRLAELMAERYTLDEVVQSVRNRIEKE